MMPACMTPQAHKQLGNIKASSYLPPTVKKRKLVSDLVDLENLHSPEKRLCVSRSKSKPLREISTKVATNSFYGKAKKAPELTKTCSTVVEISSVSKDDENSNGSSGSFSWLDNIGIKVVDRPSAAAGAGDEDKNTSIEKPDTCLVTVKSKPRSTLTTESVIESVLNDSSDGYCSDSNSSISDHESSLASITDFDQEESHTDDQGSVQITKNKFFKNREAKPKYKRSHYAYFTQMLSKKVKTPKSANRIKKMFQKTLEANNVKEETETSLGWPFNDSSCGNVEHNKVACTPSLFSDDASSLTGDTVSCYSHSVTEDSISLISCSDSLMARHDVNSDNKSNGLSSPSPPSTPKWPISFKPSPKLSNKSSPVRFLKLKESKDGKSQMILDVGQRSLGTTQCHTCGTVYTRNDPSDDLAHRRFHDRMMAVLKFPGWKKERVVENLPDGGRILMVLPTDPKYAVKKLEELKEIVDRELGFLEETSAVSNNRKTFLYISTEGKVIGVCIAQEISKAYPVLSNTPASSDSDHQMAWCCSSDSQPAICGVSRIWVFHQARRQCVATRLIDAVRRNFAFGLTLEISDIAFSDPTPDGKQFARKYTGTPNFLVYKFDQSQV